MPEYWVVSKEDEAVEVFSQPSDGAYRSRAVCAKGEVIRPVGFPDVEIAVDSFLGGA